MKDFITDRQENVLDSLVKNYIKLAHPISSKFLKEITDFNFSSATIRTEMSFLTKIGYLEQFHISAGRVPSDKGYKFFVENIKENIKKNKKTIPHKVVDFLKSFRRKKNPKFDDFDNLTKEISSFTKVFTSFSFPAKKIYFEGGWQFLSEEPESKNPEFWKEATHLVQEIDDLIDRINLKSKFPIVMIGKDLSFKNSENLSFIGAPLKFKDEDCFFYLMGPKRTSYDKNIELTDELINIFDYEQ